MLGRILLLSGLDLRFRLPTAPLLRGVRGLLGVRCASPAEQMPHGLVSRHLSRMLRFPRHGGHQMNTSAAHNAKVNGERGAMTLVKLIEEFADESLCQPSPKKLRWPDGVQCPR